MSTPNPDVVAGVRAAIQTIASDGFIIGQQRVRSTMDDLPSSVAVDTYVSVLAGVASLAMDALNDLGMNKDVILAEMLDLLG